MSTYTPYLRGDLVYLRTVEQSDLETMHLWINNSELQRWLLAFRPFDLKQEQSWFDNLDRKGTPLRLNFMICLTATDELLGTTGMHAIDWRSRKADTGSFIGEEKNRGKGYGVASKALLIRYAFDTLNLERLASHVLADNAPCIAHLLKLGYVEEGRMRRAQFVDGKWHDELVFGLLREDWRALGN